MQESKYEKAFKIDQLKDEFEVKFPHSVSCEVDVQNRTARIGRIEVVLKSDQYYIPAGWRVSIKLLRGIDYRITVIDTIPLHTIMPEIVCPIGPCVAPEIPEDIVKSEDDWNLELYLVDPYNNEKCIFRSPNVSFGEHEEERETPTPQTTRQIPKEKRIQTDQMQLICRINDKSCRYLIYAMPEVKFGRSVENDLVLQLFPVNPKNDRATRMISSQHGKFEYRNGVWRLIDNSTNGTRINGEYFRNGSRILQDGNKITIADVLELEFTRTTNHAKMRRLNNLADEETYLFITEAITLGSDQSNAMVIDDTSDFHATIFHEDGEFWVKDFGSETGTFVNGDKLRPNEICPVAEDMKIEVGKAVLKRSR